jgi:hypothetical protein
MTMARRLLPVLILLGILLAGSPPAAAGSPEDNFGYTLVPQAFSWIDATAGTQVSFPSSDNSFVGPVSIGFTFPFFENNYSQLYIATNGLVSFGQGTLLPISTAIPSSASPNNFAAALWDDLDVGGVNLGDAYYLSQGTAPNRKLIIEWLDVSLISTPGDELTFEIILHESGDVCMQYFILNGTFPNAVAGIEDADGLDGTDNSGAIASFQHFCFDRPPASARVKITPGYQSGFAVEGAASFPIVVKNIGDLGTDTFDLGYTSSSPGWSAGFSLAVTGKPPADTNGNGMADTGPIPQGGSVVVNVSTSAPANAVVGDFTTFTVTATSQLNPSVSASTTIQNAIPAPFAQAYKDSQDGLRLRYFWENSTTVTPSLFPGLSNNLSMSETSLGGFVYLWEYSYINANSKLTTESQFTMISRFGTVDVPPTAIQNNNSEPLPTTNRFPAAASNPNGKIGIVYIENIENDNLLPSEINSNVYVIILNSDGSVAAGPINVTQNTQWVAPDDFNEPLFESPRIAAAGNNFLITWIDYRIHTGFVEEADIYAAIIGESGSTVMGVTQYADSTPGGNLLSDPIAAALSSSRVLLGYTLTTSGSVPLVIKYQVLNNTGGVVKAETSISSSIGTRVDAVELSDGLILMAWIDDATDQVRYVLLNSSYNVVFGPSTLTTPLQRAARYVSVTRDEDGHGILTWLDGTGSQYLFYALINSAGTVITPPIGFLNPAAANGFLQTSLNGGGNAPYDGSLSIYLPVIVRE